MALNEPARQKVNWKARGPGNRLEALTEALAVGKAIIYSYCRFKKREPLKVLGSRQGGS